MIDKRRLGRYQRIHGQVAPLIASSPSLTAAMATLCAVLHHKMTHHFWTGFYMVADERTLHVGPYQGAVACQVLEGRGVCLHCVNTQATVIVPDVEAFPGHIACDSRSKSEIVVPLLHRDRVYAVLDIDSDKLAQFDEDDVQPLERLVGLLVPLLKSETTRGREA